MLGIMRKSWNEQNNYLFFTRLNNEDLKIKKVKFIICCLHKIDFNLKTW